MGAIGDVSFWTPVLRKDLAFKQEIGDIADAFFSWGNQSVVVDGKELKGCRPVRLYRGPPAVWWPGALKVTCCVAFPMYLLVKTAFPTYVQNKMIGYCSAVVNLLPVVLLAIKYFSRMKCNFYLYTTGDDLIPWGVKMTLDQMLGRCGAVDELPEYVWMEGEKVPQAGSMTAAVMKGFTATLEGQKVPLITLRLKCASSIEEVRAAGAAESSINSAFAEGSPVRAFTLCPLNPERMCEWYQLSESVPPVYPQFFSAGVPFTVDSGRVSRNCTLLFEKLTNIFNPAVKEGIAGDKIKWKLAEDKEKS